MTSLGPQSRALFEKSEDELAEGIAERTDGWSFAFLKELYVIISSSLLDVVANCHSLH